MPFFNTHTHTHTRTHTHAHTTHTHAHTHTRTHTHTHYTHTHTTHKHTHTLHTHTHTHTHTVMAAVSVANIVKSSLGPVGLDKMLVDDVGVRMEGGPYCTVVYTLLIHSPKYVYFYPSCEF